MDIVFFLADFRFCDVIEPVHHRADVIKSFIRGKRSSELGLQLLRRGTNPKQWPRKNGTELGAF